MNPDTGDDTRRAPAPQAQPDAAAAARAEALPGPPQRPGQVTTDLSDAPTGNCVVRQGHAYTEKQLHYKADPNSHSQRADAWREAHNQLKDQPIKTDGNGMYQTVFGDDPSTIAARSLRDQGQVVNQANIRQEWSRIVGLNRDAFPDMGKNMDYLPDNVQLRMTDCKGMPPVQVTEAPPAQPRPEHHRPHGRDHYSEDGDVPARRPAPRPPERPPVQPPPDQPVYAPPPEQGYGPPPARPGYPPPQYYAPPEQVQPAYAPPPGYQPYQYGNPNPGAFIGGAAAGIGLSLLFGGLFNRGPYYGYGGGGYWHPHWRRR